MPTQAEGERIAGERYSTDPQKDSDFEGTPGHFIRQMWYFIALGVNFLIFGCGEFPNLISFVLSINVVLSRLN